MHTLPGFYPFASGGTGSGGVSSHHDLTNLTDGDDHTQYVHIANARTITARHTFNPGVALSPFIVGGLAIGVLVSGLNADLLDGLDSAAFALVPHTHAAADIVSGQLANARGGTGADMSATGGSGFIVRQNSLGGAFTASRLVVGDIDDALITYAKIQNVTASRVLGSAAGGAPSELTASGVLDFIGSTRGSILYRGASGWAAATPGTSGYVWTSNGAGADPTWQAGGGGGANTALSNLVSVAINTALISDTATTDDLGSAAIPWKDVWAGGVGYFGGVVRLAGAVAAETVNLTHDAGRQGNLSWYLADSTTRKAQLLVKGWGGDDTTGLRIYVRGDSAGSVTSLYLGGGTIYAEYPFGVLTGKLLGLNGVVDGVYDGHGDTTPTKGFSASATSGGSITFLYDSATYFTHDGTDLSHAIPAAGGSFIVKMAATPTDYPFRVRTSADADVFMVGPTGYLDMPEQTAPAAPAANTARVYAADNGGKTALYVLFPSGAAQQIAIEP